MQHRCPQFTYVGRGVLRNHEWIINTRGYATVVPSSTGDGGSERSEDGNVSENKGRIKCDSEGADKKHGNTDGDSTKDTYGVVYTLTKSDMEKLDYYEDTYLKVTVNIQMLPPLPAAATSASSSSSSFLPCLVYIGTHTSPGTVRAEYIGRINRGLRDARLPSAWVGRVVRKWVPAGVGLDEEGEEEEEKEEEEGNRDRDRKGRRGVNKAKKVKGGRSKAVRHWEPADALKL